MKVIRYIKYLVNKYKINRNIKQGLKEVNLIKKGKIKKKPWKEIYKVVK